MFVRVDIELLACVVALRRRPACAEMKIAVVDYGRLVEESPQAKTALDAIRTEFTPQAARAAERRQRR